MYLLVLMYSCEKMETYRLSVIDRNKIQKALSSGISNCTYFMVFHYKYTWPLFGFLSVEEEKGKENDKRHLSPCFFP